MSTIKSAPTYIWVILGLSIFFAIVTSIYVEVDAAGQRMSDSMQETLDVTKGLGEE